MIIQLPEENRNLVFSLFKEKQPNNSALWCYFAGTITGKTYVDNLESPSKAICVLDMSWTYISDDADYKWIEDTLVEIIKTTWIQVVWNVEKRPDTPLQKNEKRIVIPRLEYTKCKSISNKPKNVEVAPFCAELYEKLPWKNFHDYSYGGYEAFSKKTFGFYALENGDVCSECTAAFIANGYTEINIITDKNKRQRGFAFAACIKTLEEINKRGLKPIWSCDKDNLESTKLAEKLGFINPYEYNFIFFPQMNS